MQEENSDPDDEGNNEESNEDEKDDNTESEDDEYEGFQFSAEVGFVLNPRQASNTQELDTIGQPVH